MVEGCYGRVECIYLCCKVTPTTPQSEAEQHTGDRFVHACHHKPTKERAQDSILMSVFVWLTSPPLSFTVLSLTQAEKGVHFNNFHGE